MVSGGSIGWNVPVGPNTVTVVFSCYSLTGGVAMQLSAWTPAAEVGAEISGVKSMDDATFAPFTSGRVLRAFSETLATVGAGHPFAGSTDGHFYRMGGTLVLHHLNTGVFPFRAEVTTVTFDMLQDYRTANPTCQFRGNAVPAVQ